MASTLDIASQTNAGVLIDQDQAAAISGDGNIVLFAANDPVTATEQIFTKNESTSVSTLVSTSSAGQTSNNDSFDPSLSADGSNVTFSSRGTNLVAGLPAVNTQIYEKNLASGGLILVSSTAAGVAGDQNSQDSAVSANGGVVAFDSLADNFGLGGTGANSEVYVKNISTGTLTLVSQTSAGTIANADAAADAISADGNIVVLDTAAQDLAPTGGIDQIFVKNIATGALTVASQTAAGVEANAGSFNGSVSADGTLVAFQSSASNLIAGVTAGLPQAYLKNMTTGALTLISSTSTGAVANAISGIPVISADGHYATFSSFATNLVAGASGEQVYVKNLQTGAVSLLSQTAAGAPGNSTSMTGSGAQQALSADDSKAVFLTSATNLGSPPGDTITLRDTTTGPSLTFAPVTSDNILNATELAGTVNFSGTSNAIGGTVQVSLDTAANVIGTAIVQPDGSWSFGASVAGLAQGPHTEFATAQGSSYLATTSSQAFTVNTTGPTVALNTGVSFSDAHTATLTGTVSDPSSAVTGVTLFDNGTALGNATLNGDGTFTLAGVHLGTGAQALTATATDAVGNISVQTPAPFTLETGIKHQPYSSYEEDFNGPAGAFSGETYTHKDGSVYLADTVVQTFANGNHQLDYYTGTYFDAQNFFYKSDILSADYGTLEQETLYNNDGTHSVTGSANGQTLQSLHNDTLTGGGKHETFDFLAHFGKDTVTDFVAGGNQHDTINFAASQFMNAAQVLAHTTDVNGQAVIHVGAHSTITLDNVTKADLAAHKNDITFHA